MGWFRSGNGVVVEADTALQAARVLAFHLGVDIDPQQLDICGAPGFGSPYVSAVPGRGVVRQPMQLLGTYTQPHRIPFWWVGPCTVDDDGTGLAYLPALCSDGTVIKCRDRQSATALVIRLRVLEALAFAARMRSLGIRVNVPEFAPDTLVGSQGFAVACAVQVPDHGVEAWLEQCDREKLAEVAPGTATG